MIWLLLVALLALADPAWAACSGSSPNLTAASAAYSEVNACVAIAVSGDTITVPSGSATWSSTLTFPAATDLVIQGAGIGNTVIACSTTNPCFAMSHDGNQRLTGFEFNWTTSTDIFIAVHGVVTNGKQFRIDHNKLSAPSTTWSILDIAGSGPTAKHPSGVIDNNEFANFSIHFNGTDFSLTDGTTQHVLWSQSITFGDATDVVYVEDNAFTSNQASGFQNYADGNYGARFVWRNNTMTGHGTGVEIHSVQGANRAVRRWEIYGNTFSKSGASFYPVVFARGGTGFIFDNTVDTDFTNDLLLDNVRSMGNPDAANSSDADGGVGTCNGNSSWDQNTASMNGYACRDQIGRGGDTSTWSVGAGYTQPLLGAYFWNNPKGGSQTSVVIDDTCGSLYCVPSGGLNTTHIVANRDYYQHNDSFTGTTGVGRGTLANRPATCTTGVAYWVTDRGNWNKNLLPAASGRLDKCTATNTWTEGYYMPWCYPHNVVSGNACTQDATYSADSGGSSSGSGLGQPLGHRQSLPIQPSLGHRFRL